MSNETADKLAALVDGRKTSDVTSSGLYLQFRGGDADNPDCRLCCYRIGGSVGTGELVTLRRELESLLNDIIVFLSKEKSYQGKDGRMRYFHVFSWRQPSPGTQLELLTVEAAKRPYTED